MKLKWKAFKGTYPYICTKCNNISNMLRDFCEKCGSEKSFRTITKDDYDKLQKE